MLRIADAAALDPALGEAGYPPARRIAAGPPGVHLDSPRGSQQVPDEPWGRRLFTAYDPDCVLHVRICDSPWGEHARGTLRRRSTSYDLAVGATDPDDLPRGVIHSDTYCDQLV